MADGKLKRPFYFMAPFWGQRYRDYFVDLCLPSLLAPNNIPLLRAEDGHRFLIATTREDWEAIEHLPIMERLRQHATPTWIEVGYPSTAAADEVFTQYSATIWHQNLCQKKLVEAAYRARAYGCLLCPDFILSDGMVAALLKYAQAGYHLVLCPALRQTEEAVLEDLCKRGMLPKGARLSMTGQALAIPPRVMADLFVRHLHPEMWIFGEDDSSLVPYAPWVYWRVPGGRGMLLHTYFGIPVLMDYAVMPVNHAECLNRDTLENVYYSRNFAQSNRVRLIQDSDEFGIVSLTPAAVNWAPPQQTKESPRLRWPQKYNRLCNIRESMWQHAGRNRDALRRDLFRLPIRWHAADLDEVWNKEEQQIDRLINNAVGDYYRVSAAPNRERFPRKFSLDLRVLLSITFAVRGVVQSRLINPGSRLIRDVNNVIRIIGRRVGLALCGDKAALRWWGWRLRKLGAGAIGRPFQEPRPPTPE